MKTRHQCSHEPVAMADALREWYAGSVGQALIAELDSGMDSLLTHRFGYHALQIGRFAPNLLDHCHIRHHIHMDIDPGRGSVCARADALPFDEDSLDLIVLMHGLDFTDDPHQVLREVDRTLIPQGYVVIIGFNPWSLFGAARFVSRWRNRLPWCGRFYTQNRIRDWLALLGFESQRCSYIGFRPPVPWRGMFERLAFMERAGQRVLPFMGGVYVLFAQKQVAKLTPIKTAWLPRRKLLSGNLEPTTRDSALRGQRRSASAR